MENYIQNTLDIIKRQFKAIMDGDSFYKPFKNNVEIVDEQLFAKKDKTVPNSIYIVVRFNNTSLDLGQILLPVTLNAVSEQNSIFVCQKLLFDFAESYTLKTVPDESDFIKQIWNTPNVINNFNEVADGFRSLFSATGTFIIGKNSSPLTEFKFYVDGNENNKSKDNEIDLFESIIIFSENADFNLDSQSFYSTSGLNKSKVRNGSYSFNISCFKLSNDFFTLCKMIKRGTTKLAKDGVTVLGEGGINTDFRISLKDKDDDEPWVETFKLTNSVVQQNKGDLPTISLTFAR